MPTYRMVIEYDGSRFQGWQVQNRGRTVQGVLLDALRKAIGERGVDVQGAGRTDAGVHALGQVASVRCRRRVDPEALHSRLDEVLPQDLAVREIRQAAPGFHARHDAEARAYRYQLARRRSAFGKRYTWWTPGELDAAAMAAAGRAFEGRHDFAALARRSGERASTLVAVEAVQLEAVGDLVLLRVVASHFLWNQVRRMVGALVTVGRGEAPATAVAGWLAGATPPPALAAPAAGLFLEGVRYPGEPWVLPALTPIGVPGAVLGGPGVPG